MRTSDTERSTAVAGQLVDDLQRLAALQIDMAKAELKELVVSNIVAGAGLAVAGLLVLIALLVALPVILVAALPWHWQVALAWLVLYLLIALVVGLAARSRLRLTLPQKTLRALKENKQWALQLMNSSRR
ncbi:MAG TPA: phage holin family protein [Candidatus Nitrosotalea sp.]|nr:phage holin family protein [Candidatus Nitrosotalea sp.]